MCNTPQESFEATFVPLQHSWQKIHQLNKLAVSSKQPALRCSVTGEILYYLDVHIDQLLSSPDFLTSELDGLHVNYQHHANDTFFCIALKSLESNRGLLVFQNEQRWYCACLPLMLPENIQQENHCSALLESTADIILTQKIDRQIILPGTVWHLSDLLCHLSHILKT